jgi:hypothetical protein
MNEWMNEWIKWMKWTNEGMNEWWEWMNVILINEIQIVTENVTSTTAYYVLHVCGKIYNYTNQEVEFSN